MAGVCGLTGGSLAGLIRCGLTRLEERHTLAEKLAWVEAFYHRWGGPARYQICPAAQPADLDDILAERGYTLDARTAVQTASLATVMACAETGFDPANVTVSERLSEDWFAAYCEAEAVVPEAAEGRRGILGRIGPPVGYALLWVDGAAVGMGLAVVERGWVGIFSMATHPAFRRRGYARAVIHALAAWGQTRGADQMYLQVMESNGVAQALYARLGFETLYHYHYRELVGGVSPAC